MDRVVHTVKGLDAVRARLSALPAAVATEAAAALGDVAEAAADDLRLTLAQGPGIASGAPSRPGGPPNDPHGRIAAAVRVAPTGEGTGATVMVDLPFARDLEFGTARMAPRPFLRPVMLQARAKATAALGAVLRRMSSAKGPSR